MDLKAAVAVFSTDHVTVVKDTAIACLVTVAPELFAPRQTKCYMGEPAAWLHRIDVFCWNGQWPTHLDRALSLSHAGDVGEGGRVGQHRKTSDVLVVVVPVDGDACQSCFVGKPVTFTTQRTGQ